jgi:hypothetical protein
LTECAIGATPPADGASDDSEIPSSCEPPYVVADGIKRFRVECLASPPCHPPFFVNDDGIKRFRDECVESPPTADRCSPPYDLLEGVDVRACYSRWQTRRRPSVRFVALEERHPPSRLLLQRLHA